MSNDYDPILEFWFGSQERSAAVAAEKNSMWWSKDDDLDMEIITRFGELPEAVADDELDEWEQSAHGLLALIICTDQFPRNMFRNTAKSFAFDPAARALAQRMVETGLDRQLRPIERVFAYLPYEHSENLGDQERSLQLYQRLVDEVDADERELFAGYHGFAERHFEAVRRFGRFPHRNAILGRDSSEDELQFLQQPGSAF